MNITKGTLARTIILALALINQILSVCGIAVLPIEDGQVETLGFHGLDGCSRGRRLVEEQQLYFGSHRR